jgi:ubiquinone/menaquinone biosynthesis C-methylase UbiE
MADWYAKHIETSSVQGMVTCAVMSNMQKCKRVLEVACGPGCHSKILATSFLNRDGGVLVSCDYAPNMVKKLKETFDEE